MRRATITIPEDVERRLEEFVAAQSARPSLAAVVQLALRRFLGEPAGGAASTVETVLRHRPAIRRIAALHGATAVRLFGSAARGEAAPGDVDLLVALEPGRTLFDLARLRAELEALLGLAVDVVADSGLNGELRDQILTEAITL